MATLRLTLLALVSFALFAPSASAIRVTNLTTGQILFQDNFESVPAYNGPYTSGSGDFDPVAAVGVWDMGPFGGGDNEPVDYDNQVVSSTTDLSFRLGQRRRAGVVRLGSPLRLSVRFFKSSFSASSPGELRALLGPRGAAVLLPVPFGVSS